MRKVQGKRPKCPFWMRRVVPREVREWEAARPGLCIYLSFYLQGTLALGPPHLSPTSQRAALMGTVLAVLPVLGQGPTRHPRHAALVGAGRQLERA